MTMIWHCIWEFPVRIGTCTRTYPMAVVKYKKSSKEKFTAPTNLASESTKIDSYIDTVHEQICMAVHDDLGPSGLLIP